MCGRYAIIDGKKVFLTFELMKKLREAGKPFETLPRYNAAPMQKLPVVAIRDGELTIQLMQWWLIPHWSKAAKTEFSTFNAKSETVEKSSLFSPYFKGSRCLVPANAFYEWKKEVSGKQPVCIRLKDKPLFFFAGLFSVWKDRAKPDEGEELATFTILTTTPNFLMKPIHNRMPVILDEKHFEQWLDRDFKDVDALKKILKPYSPVKMKSYLVSAIVSNSRNDVAECMKPIDKPTKIVLRKAVDLKKP